MRCPLTGIALAIPCPLMTVQASEAVSSNRSTHFCQSSLRQLGVLSTRMLMALQCWAPWF